MNTRGTYPDINHNVSWPLVRNIETLWLLVLKPFWALPLNPELVQAILRERVTDFCSSLTQLLLAQLFDHKPLAAGATSPEPTLAAGAIW
jgi:hypothetical protein